VIPSGRFSRFAVAAVAFFALLVIADIEFVRPVTTRLLVSNSLDLAAAVLAAACSLLAARRSSGYPRQLWLLLTAAFTLESVAEGISSYYQSFVPAAAQNPWPSDIFFFVWAAPVFMIFLPLSDEDAAGIDSIRLLDFLQVAILALTLYLYFFYSPSRWQENPAALLRQILFVYISRDSLLALAFFFRSRALVPSWLRTFCLALSAVFFVQVFADVGYLLAIVDTRISSGWGDLILLLPSGIVILFAGNWKQPVSTELSRGPTRLASLLNTEILPVAIPLLVIFMGRAIAREQVVFAWLVVAGSVLCSSVRLILTNRRQRRVAEYVLSTERALRSSEQTLSTAFRNSPDAFSINGFPNGPYLELNDGFTRLTGYSRDETLGKSPGQMNLWVDIDRRDQALAALMQSGHLRDFEFRFRTKNGQTRVGQMSASLMGLRGERCLLASVRDITKRIEAEEILRSSEERFRVLVRDLYFAVVLHTPTAVVEFANRAAHRMLDIPEGAAIGKALQDLGIYPVKENGEPLPFEDNPVSHVLRTGEPIHNRLMAFRKAGEERMYWLFGSTVLQRDTNGEIIRVISSFADVTEMKSAERAVHQLSKQLLNLQDEERRRLGRELHDGLAQTVLAINLSLAQARQSIPSPDPIAMRSLDTARALTQEMSREIRTLSYLLHPPLLDDLGLTSTLKEYVQGFSERCGIETQLFLDTEFDRLPQPIEIALFRIVQESLANIQRHSGSPSAQIRLTRGNSLLKLEVLDFGRGFYEGATADGEGSRPPRFGVGIPGMRERMAQLGGRLEIISGSTGTVVRATIPLPSAARTELFDDRSSHSDRG
jgi:PAS domain S-box-containing protein